MLNNVFNAAIRASWEKTPIGHSLLIFNSVIHNFA